MLSQRAEMVEEITLAFLIYQGFRSRCSALEDLACLGIHDIRIDAVVNEVLLNSIWDARRLLGVRLTFSYY